jgi:hypothetical protein
VGGADPAGRAEPLLEGFDGYNQSSTGDQSHTLRGLAPGDTTTGSHMAVPLVQDRRGAYDVPGAGETDGTVAPPRPDVPQAVESRFARNGRGAPSGEVPPLKAQSGQTGKGDAAPLIIPAQDPSLGQGESVPFAPGQRGWRGDPAQETYVRDGATQALTSRFGNSGTDYPDAEAGWVVAGQQQPDPLGQDEAGSLGSMGTTGGHRLDLDSAGAYVAGPGTDVTHTLTSEGHDATEDGTGRGTPIVSVPDPTGGQELAATLKGQRGKGGGGIGPEETLLPVDEATGFYSTGGTHGLHGNEGESPALKVGSGIGIPSPPAVFSKRHAASDADDSETWDESEQAHTLNQNMNAPDVAADAQAVRRLTPTEAERLQGVPDGWTLPYGPSLADAPAWHDLRNPPLPVRAVTINEGNDTPQGSVWESDQCGSLATGGGKPGQGYHAVRTEPADPTWIGLDNANRGNDHVKEGQQSSEALRAKGTLDQAVCFHSDALGRDGEAKNDSPDAEGRMRKRDAGTGIAEGESYNLTTGAPHAVGYTVHGENSTAMQGDGEAAVAFETEAARSLDRSGGYATNQGGNVVGVYPDPLSPALTRAGFHGNADGSDDQVEATALAFEQRYYSDRARMGGAPSGEAGPVKATDSKAGDAAQVVAFAQNQRDEVRELDDASSLSGQGTHQTTYVAEPVGFDRDTRMDTPAEGSAPTLRGHRFSAGNACVSHHSAVAAGIACPYDCPPDGPRYAALGDAVTAPVARWIGERLVDVLRERGVIAADGAVDLGADLS